MTASTATEILRAYLTGLRILAQTRKILSNMQVSTSNLPLFHDSIVFAYVNSILVPHVKWSGLSVVLPLQLKILIE